MAAIAASIAYIAGGVPPPAAAQELVVTELRILTHESGKNGLEAIMVRPNDAAPHPLALMTHGSPRDPGERVEMTPLRFIPQAREFARRGWTTVVVMRRGYGDSGGRYAEDTHACSRFVNYADATKEAVRDLRAASAYLSSRPEVDPSRMISIGVSAGGLAMVGLAADPPPGLMAAISFAGGRGSESPDQVCNPDVLVDTFAAFGKHSKTSMLWVYAANDHYFGPQLAQNFYQAFTKAGGNAKFIAAGPFGEDGHGLFSLRGIPIWAPMVDDFLKSQNLVLRNTPLEVTLPAVDPPHNLSDNGRKEFQTYLLSAPHKAFAVSTTGSFGASSGRRTAREAEQHALENCKKAAPKNEPCTAVMIDDNKTGN
jgi:dienelactone hydrolase